jgi:Zn-dependent protease with chaperone function
MIIALTWLWQGVVLAGLTVLLLRALPHLNAATRHAVWWASLLAVLSIPLVLAAGSERDALPGFPSPRLTDGFQPALVLPVAPGWVGLLCASAWGLALLCGLVRVVHGCRVVRALRRTSTPFDLDRERHLPLWCDTRRHARRPAQLRISDTVAGACALGFRQPVILVGRTLVERLDDAVLDQVVMHEYAHLTRYDDWLQLLEAIARAVGGLHPAVCWISRRIDSEREAACDDFVVARTGAARQYASALLEAAVAAGVRPTPIAMVPAATLRGSALRRRVARLLDPARATGTRATPMAAVGMVLPVVAILAGPRVAPLVAFVDVAVEQIVSLENLAGYEGGLSALPQAPDHAVGLPWTEPIDGSGGETLSPSRRPGRVHAVVHTPEPPVADAVPAPVDALPALARAPIESRRLFDRVDARLLSAAPAATMNGLPVAARPAPVTGHSLATRSLAGTQAVAAAVASGAERGGVSLGRAFARAGKGIAGKF